jgi:hypothetical protein
MPRIRTFDEYPFGCSWVIDEPMTRTSHALVADGRVWLVDPVDLPEAMERAAALGEPAGVLQLLDRHNRDCAVVARRLGVPHLNVPDDVPGSPFEAIGVLRLRGWHETALWWPEQRALVVAEIVGTNDLYTGGAHAVGVHLFLRAWPPSGLRGMRPEHLLVGHGVGVHGPAATAELERAFARTRHDLPRVLLSLPRAWRRG